MCISYVFLGYISGSNTSTPRLILDLYYCSVISFRLFPGNFTSSYSSGNRQQWEGEKNVEFLPSGKAKEQGLPKHWPEFP